MDTRATRSFAAVLLVVALLAINTGSAAGGADRASRGPTALRAPVVGRSVIDEAYRSANPIPGATLVYLDTMNDPRVSGTRTATVAGFQRPDLSGAFHGTSVIRNADGTWRGTWNGLFERGAATRYFSAEYTGDDAYEGLTYHVDGWFTGSADDPMPGSRFWAVGWIESDDGSPVEVTPAPEGVTPVVGDARFVKAGAKWVYDLTMSDPRVSGRLRSVPNVDFAPRPDGSADLSGPFVLRDGDGTWVCSNFTGEAGKGMIEHFVYCKAKGTGAYEGLHFRSLWHFFEPYEVYGDVFENAGSIS
jgi:hypothetical protein